MTMRRTLFRSIVLMLAGLVPAAIMAQTPPTAKKAMSLTVTSSAFAEGQPIPAKHTCQGEDASPPLQWNGKSAGAKSYALICDDPDAPAGTWVHWVIYNIPGSVTELAEKLATSDTLPDGTLQGVNDFKKAGYGGPCPPAGKPHRYLFKLYALDVVLSLKPRATKRELLDAMSGHVIAEGRLMGTFQRR